MGIKRCFARGRMRFIKPGILGFTISALIAILCVVIQGKIIFWPMISCITFIFGVLPLFTAIILYTIYLCVSIDGELKQVNPSFEKNHSSIKRKSIVNIIEHKNAIDFTNWENKTLKAHVFKRYSCFNEEELLNRRRVQSNKRINSWHGENFNLVDNITKSYTSLLKSSPILKELKRSDVLSYSSGGISPISSGKDELFDYNYDNSYCCDDVIDDYEDENETGNGIEDDFIDMSVQIEEQDEKKSNFGNELNDSPYSRYFYDKFRVKRHEKFLYLKQFKLKKR